MKRKGRAPAALFLLLVLLSAAFGVSAETAQGYKSQTIMVYIIGSDLESDDGIATLDLGEMLAARPDRDRLKVLVMAGGTGDWKNPVISEDKLGVYRIDRLYPVPVAQMPRASMGDPDTLTAFLDYCVENYPAESYGLVLWDHGGGPMFGFGMDTLYRGDGLTLKEMEAALAASPFGNGLRLEWLAFDACLMGSFEVAAMAAPFARYLIASEETVPASGFDYAFLSELASGSLTGPEVARSLIDRTFSYNDRVLEAYPDLDWPLTFSLTDLDNIWQVRDALEGLFGNLNRGLQAGFYSRIARSRDRTKAYGRSGTTDDYDLIDLYDLAENMKGLYPEEAGRLQQAIGDAVLYNRSNVPRSAGLSIYFPLVNKELYAGGWDRLHRGFGYAPGYEAFVERFGEILMADSLSQWTGEDTPPVVFNEETGEYYIQLSPEQTAHFERGEYYVLARLRGEEYLMVYMSSDLKLDETGRLSAVFDGRTLFFGEEPDSPIPYMRERENLQGVATYQLPAVFSRTQPGGGLDSVRGELLAQLDKNTGSARVIGAIRTPGTAFLLGKQDLDLSAWDSAHLVINSFYLTRDESGSLLPLGNWVSADTPRIVTLKDPSALRARYGSLPVNRYEFFVLISIIDTQGNVYSSELMPLKTEEGQGNQELPSRPLPLEADFPAGSAPVPLHEEDGLSVALYGIGTDPEALFLNLRAENRGNREVEVAADWAAVDGFMADAEGTALLAPGDTAELSLRMPLAGVDGSPGLARLGLKRAREIRLRLRLDRPGTGFFGSGRSREILIRTDLGLPDLHLAPAPVPGRLLAQGEGVSIRLAGEPRLEPEKLSVPLMVVNESGLYDTVEIAESSVNGIMAPMAFKGHVLPGGILYTQAEISRCRTRLPEELSQYSYLFEGLDNLEALGIDRVVSVGLRFSLDAEHLRDTGGSRSVRVLLPPAGVRLAGLAVEPGMPSAKGEEIYSREGVRVLRLTEDPRGRLFLIQNEGTRSILLSSAGTVEIDGKPYTGNLPLTATVSPGKAAYARLFGMIPGHDPGGRELSFRLSLIDLEENRVLAPEEKISLLLPETE